MCRVETLTFTLHLFTKTTAEYFATECYCSKASYARKKNKTQSISIVRIQRTCTGEPSLNMMDGNAFSVKTLTSEETLELHHEELGFAKCKLLLKDNRDYFPKNSPVWGILKWLIFYCTMCVVLFIFFSGIEESRLFSMRRMLMRKANMHTFLICECLALF